MIGANVMGETSEILQARAYARVGACPQARTV